MLEGKAVVLAVTGSIAAYKIADLASMLTKRGCDVTVTMTENATRFIHPITFETLTGNKCLVDTFDRNFQYSVEHVALAARADVCLVAPASADVIGKMANGIADDMLTTTVLACDCKKIVAPAMNARMYRNPVVQDNLRKLRGYGVEVIEPDVGRLACGEVGEGKMPSPETLLAYVEREVGWEKDLAGKRVLVTAGPTREAIDPVRFLTNRSTGKMGYALAKAAMLRGALVTLVSGPTSIEPPRFVDVARVESAREMMEAVRARYLEQDVFLLAAAVADYAPPAVAAEKIKKGDGPLTLSLERTGDILEFLGRERRDGQFLCGFSMETENLVERSREKMERKRADCIVANSLRREGAGFGTDTNAVTILLRRRTAGGAIEERELPLMGKDQVAHAILDAIREEL